MYKYNTNDYLKNDINGMSILHNDNNQLLIVIQMLPSSLFGILPSLNSEWFTIMTSNSIIHIFPKGYKMNIIDVVTTALKDWRRIYDNMNINQFRSFKVTR